MCSMARVTKDVERWTGMNVLFGACMGATIYCLVTHKEYFHALLAVLALAIYILTIYRLI
jgi:hypothetical protein